MIGTSHTLPGKKLGWVLLANSARARSFVRDSDNNAMRELCSFVHPDSRLKGQALAHDRGGKVRKSGASTQFAPHTDHHDKVHGEFARELAAYLEEAALAHRYPEVAIIAAKPFLGELRAHLGPATQQRLSGSVALDLTTCVGAELERRVADALATSRQRGSDLATT